MSTDNGITLTAAEFDPSIHDGEITLTSPRTGEHRTFRIKTIHREGHDLDGKRTLALLTGPDNGGDYTNFAFINPTDDGGCRIAVYKKFRGDGEAPSLWERYAGMIQNPRYWAGRGVEYLVAARCRRCGKLLTHDVSIKDGYGPECRRKLGR